MCDFIGLNWGNVQVNRPVSRLTRVDSNWNQGDFDWNQGNSCWNRLDASVKWVNSNWLDSGWKRGKVNWNQAVSN